MVYIRSPDILITHYSHTFKGVEIETISVSESGFSVSFSSSDGGWDAQINYEKRF